MVELMRFDWFSGGDVVSCFFVTLCRSYSDYAFVFS